MTKAELDRLEAVAAAATPGPWEWAERRFNRKYQVPMKNGRVRAKPGRSIRDSWVYALVGPIMPVHPDSIRNRPKDPETGMPPGIDEHDYRRVMALRWFQVKGKTLFNVHPSPKDADFIAEARTAVPALLAEVRRLQEENAALRQELEERPAMTAQDDPSPDRHPSLPPSDRKEPSR